MKTTMSEKTFKELEHDGWIERANSYEIITHVTNQAIAPIIEALGDCANKEILEIACGPGHLASALLAAGATVEAIDFASTMVQRAQSRYPEVTFSEGDAEDLSFDDNRFDSAVCAFGLLHLAHPDNAIAEAFRVLKPGGRYVYTVWCPPEEGGEFFGFLMNAIQQHGDLNVPLPPSPPFYRFADPAEAENTLTQAGFDTPTITTTPVVWRGERPSDAVDVIYKATVRTKLILDAQTDADRDAIHAAIIAGVEKFRVDDHYEVALPAVVVCANKPA